ncbi:hypothetical protein [Pedobacter agri]|uniref:P-loop NTPase n=1 Tax=Pedobacter agri TaxID=454586 RepID=UPI00292F4BF5|nr:hypothetical protein [Pedobacter agri]
MSFETVIKKLQDGPAVLLIGQSYLSMETGKDYILEKIYSKYAPESGNDRLSYRGIVNLGLSENGLSVFQWLQALCKNISTPSALYHAARFPWSAVYTTATDIIIERAFTSDKRTVQPILNERYLVSDPRNKKHLHISYLFGNIAAADSSDRPALKPLELSRRKNTMNALLIKLQQIVSPRGILVIEGYSDIDQLDLDDLYGYLEKFGPGQVLMCSADDSLISDERIKDLIERGKIIISKYSFAFLLSNWESEGKISFENQDGEEYIGKWLTLPHDRVKLPEDIISRVSQSAFIPDDSTFYTDEIKTDDEHYKDFRKFLSSNGVLPDWEGYTQGFAFKRDYYEQLKAKVVDAYDAKEYRETPLVLLGQTSSGKTTSLGLLAYELRNEHKYPVLFIPKRYQRGDDISIDSFCRWSEANKAKATVIIWDGMLDMEPYYKLLSLLNQRGRKVILVCSCYLTKPEEAEQRKGNYIEAPIDLTDHEKSRFVDYLKSVNKSLANVISEVENTNLLALLYRYLPTNLAGIRSGVHDEYRFFVKLLAARKVKQEKKKGDLYDMLFDAGLISVQDDGVYLDTPLFMASDTISVADFLIFSVMVPGQYGLNVPFELMLDVIGYDTFASHIFSAMRDIDLIKWYDDEYGNIELGARTSLEAEILSKYAGGKKSEAAYLMVLLERVRTEMGKYFGAFDRQVEFAVQLLSEIGPNSKSGYSESFYQITEILRTLRETRSAYHPRLVLKESSILRKIVQKKRDMPWVVESSLDILLRAEKMVRKAMEDLGVHSEKMIVAYLRVELATICGYLAQQYINEPETAIDYYHQVKSLNNYSFSTNPSNYLALDVAAWTTEKMLEAKVFSEEEKIEAETDLLSLFEMAEAEGVSAEFQEDFHRRKMGFYEIVGKTELAEDVFQKMKASGFTDGIYLRAKKKLGLGTEEESSRERLMLKNREAFNYLNRFYEDIKDDGKCLFLLLKTWWASKLGTVFFAEERQTVAFDRADWDFCMQITTRLLGKQEKFHSGTVYYLKALAQFHLDFIKPAMDTFDQLQDESYKFSYGRRRIAKYYMYSTPNGAARQFSGEVKENVSQARHDKRGEIYVPELALVVPFNLSDFRQSSFQKGDRLSHFGIAFNFLGPIATPAKS